MDDTRIYAGLFINITHWKRFISSLLSVVGNGSRFGSSCPFNIISCDTMPYILLWSHIKIRFSKSVRTQYPPLNFLPGELSLGLSLSIKCYFSWESDHLFLIISPPSSQFQVKFIAPSSFLLYCTRSMPVLLIYNFSSPLDRNTFLPRNKRLHLHSKWYQHMVIEWLHDVSSICKHHQLSYFKKPMRTSAWCTTTEGF